MEKGPIIGAHLSAAGGYVNAVLVARHIGAQALQFFASSPRQWAVRMPAKRDVEAFRAEAHRSKIGPIFLHAPYLINLGSPEVGLWKRSVALMTAQMRIAEAVGALGVVVHIGSGEAGLFRGQALDRAVAGAKQVLRQAPLRRGSGRAGEPLFIIENAAGGGEKLGRDLAEVALLMKKIGSKRVGACFDTAHAFEAAAVPGYAAKDVAWLAEEVERTIGFDRLVLLHVNDSKTAYDSRHDRHENIGKGYIGADGFRNLLAHPRFRALPLILEVPGFDGKGPDKKNVDILRGLA
jgi:deoxyribonuclease-4